MIDPPVLAATRNVSGIPFHVKAARDSGATRQEVLSSVLLGLSGVGSAVFAAVPAALEAYADQPVQPTGRGAAFATEMNRHHHNRSDNHNGKD